MILKALVLCTVCAAITVLYCAVIEAEKEEKRIREYEAIDRGDND